MTQSSEEFQNIFGMEEKAVDSNALVGIEVEKRSSARDKTVIESKEAPVTDLSTAKAKENGTWAAKRTSVQRRLRSLSDQFHHHHDSSETSPTQKRIHSPIGFKPRRSSETSSKEHSHSPTRPPRNPFDTLRRSKNSNPRARSAESTAAGSLNSRTANHKFSKHYSEYHLGHARNKSIPIPEEHPVDSIAGAMEFITRDVEGFSAYFSFLRGYYAEESLMFWNSVEVLRKVMSNELYADKDITNDGIFQTLRRRRFSSAIEHLDFQSTCHEIIECFLMESSEFQVNVSSKASSQVTAMWNDSFNSPQELLDALSRAQSEVFEVLLQDQFRKFLRSPTLPLQFRHLKDYD